MTEEEAREEVRARVTAAALGRLEQLVAIVIAENDRQNLIAAGTVATIWARHVLDSIQLIGWGVEGLWLDIGTGGGFPGLAVAAASSRPMLLTEPRRRRAEFLRQAVVELGLSGVDVVQQRVEAMAPVGAAIISARAVAPIGKLLSDAFHCADRETCWILPRGRSYEQDMHDSAHQWTGVFHVEQSISDPAARLVIITGAARR